MQKLTKLILGSLAACLVIFAFACGGEDDGGKSQGEQQRASGVKIGVSLLTGFRGFSTDHYRGRIRCRQAERPDSGFHCAEG